MFCPNCGNENSIEQKFCRSCGLSLEKAAQSLAEQLPSKLTKAQRSQKEKYERLGMIALSLFGLGIFGMILYGVVYRVIFVQGRTWEGLGVLGFIALIACGILASIFFAQANESDKLLIKSKPKPDRELRAPSQTGKLLAESELEPVPSVTERTTELLFAEQKRPPEHN